MGEVGRAADQLGTSCGQQLQRHLAGLAGRRRRPLGRQLALAGVDRRSKRLPAAPGDGRVELRCGASAARPVPLVPGGVRPAARSPAARQAAQDLVRHLERRIGPAQRLRARPRSRPRPAGCRGVGGLPALVGRALADHRLAGDQRRPVGLGPCRGDRLLDRRRVVAVDRSPCASHRPRSAPAGRRTPTARSGRRSRCRCRRTARSAGRASGGRRARPPRG